MYLMSSRVLAGRVQILLPHYAKYSVGSLGSLVSVPAPAG